MGDWPRLVNLRRCARAAISDTGEATNTTIGLFNNSLGPELILVWQMGVNEVTIGIPQTSYQQVQPFGTVVPTVSVVPGDAPPPGILSSGDSAVLYTPDYYPSIAAGAPGWPATFPFAVLQPGWSLITQIVGGGTGALSVCFFWEAILSKYFDRVHTMAQVELDILAEST